MQLVVVDAEVVRQLVHDGHQHLLDDLLAGLAVLASEFEWAQRLLLWVKERVRRLTNWTGRQPRWLKALGTLALVMCVLVVVWGYLAVLGVPGWLPGSFESWLRGLPLLG